MILASILCPTRDRAELLAKSLDSLFRLADDPSRVEVLLAIDPDQPVPELPAGCNITVWRAPERYGYRRVHEYFNHLASLAEGQWLWVWNDDLVMCTHAWDSIIAAQAPALLFPADNGPAHCNGFPVVPAEWIRVLGHVSLETYADTWLQLIAEALGRQVPVPILLHHDTPHDQTWHEGRGTEPPWTNADSPGLHEDIVKLGQYFTAGGS